MISKWSWYSRNQEDLHKNRKGIMYITSDYFKLVPIIWKVSLKWFRKIYIKLKNISIQFFIARQLTHFCNSWQDKYGEDRDKIKRKRRERWEGDKMSKSRWPDGAQNGTKQRLRQDLEKTENKKTDTVSRWDREQTKMRQLL